MDKELLLQQIITGQHPSPVEALLEMVENKEITREYLLYQIPLPPKLRAEVVDRLPVWGGTREGSGRPATGRKKRNYYVTDEEDMKIKELIESLRK